ncbi:MAG TPA: FAD-dependent monooxygenase [Burkholderiaceae bacterium]|nr:FAD-dependent monooxygenase [Burkholderiaceae bacterium]
MSRAAPIAILGGGPTGLTCALMLARSGRTSVVFDAQAAGAAHADRRLLALGRGSWQIVQPLLATLPPRAPITDVFVSSAGEFGATHIGARDFDGEELGATVFFGDLVAALEQAAGASAAIEQRRPQRVVDVQQAPDRVRVFCGDSEPFEAALAIHAEGWAALPGADERADDVSAPVALVGDVTLAGPAAGAAFERFTRDGPLALLPRPGTPSLRSLVWCMAPAAAERREALSADALRQELQQAIGARIGKITSIGALHRHRLHERVRAEVQAHRCVAIGNAAQTLHPVAGQGFNLALRDCASLLDCLVAHADDVAGAFADYARRRRADRTTIAAVTHWLPQLFTTRFVPIAAARALGLTALDLIPPLRNELAHLLMFGVR